MQGFATGTLNPGTQFSVINKLNAVMKQGFNPNYCTNMTDQFRDGNGFSHRPRCSVPVCTAGRPARQCRSCLPGQLMQSAPICSCPQMLHTLNATPNQTQEVRTVNCAIVSHMIILAVPLALVTSTHLDLDIFQN